MLVVNAEALVSFCHKSQWPEIATLRQLLWVIGFCLRVRHAYFSINFSSDTLSTSDFHLNQVSSNYYLHNLPWIIFSNLRASAKLGYCNTSHKIFIRTKMGWYKYNIEHRVKHIMNQEISINIFEFKPTICHKHLLHKGQFVGYTVLLALEITTFGRRV